jgi:uncharacterized protein YndB with AHSA1/START domain
MDDAYQALTTQTGLAGWWTSDVRGDGTQVGNILEFRFEAGGFDMKVIDLKEPTSVTWEVIAGPDEWVGTTIQFDLKQDGEYTIVLFKHLNWKEPIEFMHHCSTKWAIFLMSLKSLLESGQGNPAPRDIKIDNWN